jgi:predicted ArsR family transcriptional regulator
VTPATRDKRSEVCELIACLHEGRWTIPGLCEAMGMKEERARDWVMSLAAVGLVRSVGQSNLKGGRPADVWEWVR